MVARTFTAWADVPTGTRLIFGASNHLALTASPNRRYSQLQGGLVAFF